MEKDEAAKTLINAKGSEFGITVEGLVEIVESYLGRNFCEEIELLKSETIEAFEEKLKTSFKNGLADDDSQESRIEVFGSNRKKEPELTSFLRFCLDALGDQILIILLILGVVSLIVGATGEHPDYGWVEGFAIFVAVAVVVFVSASMNYSKQNKFRELQELHKSRAGVSILRNSRLQVLHPEEVLVGDIISIETGSIIPADGLIIKANSLQLNEAALTGENDLMHKETLKDCNKLRRKILKVSKENPDLKLTKHDVPSPVIISGTSVAQGTGIFVTIAVGPNSKEGRITGLAEQETEETPLEKKLENMADKITIVGLLAGTIALVALYLRFFIRLGMGTYDWKGQTSITELISYFMIAFTVIAVAIPEGLPLAVTISLAYSVKKMQKDNNLVKQLAACETMGGVDMICSDKTGTLTQNKMVLNRFSLGISKQDSGRESATYSVENLPKLFSRNKEYFELLQEGICLTTTARVENTEKGPKDVGSQTELAIIKMLISINQNEYESIRKQYEPLTLKYNPFSSERKRSSIIIERPDGVKRIYVIGAPDFVIKSCEYGVDFNLSVSSLGEIEQLNFIRIQEEMAKYGLRTLTIAYRDLSDDEPVDETDNRGFPVLETEGLIVLGIFGIYDPPRDNVTESIKKCKSAGIRVRMVTGDNAKTAEAIAKEIGITTDFSRVMEGPTFNSIVGGTVCEKCKTIECPCPRHGKEARNDVVGNIEEFNRIIEDIDVLARSSPEDKYTMVTGLKQVGHCVAVTGDGTNDAPALKKANVGFAMGIAGTEYARQAADIILVDDNFGSIVKAAIWGRSIYDNIQRFIQFQLTVNVVAVTCSIIGAITIQQSALTAVQMLWVNMIMDSLASLALATEDPTDDVLDRSPQNPNEFIVTPLMFKHIFGQAFCMGVLILTFMFDGENIFREYNTNHKEVCHNPDNFDFVCSGRYYDFTSGEDYIKTNYDELGPSRHFTYIFNIFIWFQLFNEINSRKIRDEVWTFEGLGRAPMFVIIWFITAGFQVLIVQVGYRAFEVSKYGLTVEQWFTCIAWGAVPLVWRFILLLIPGFKKMHIKEPTPPKTHLSNLVHKGSASSRKVFSSSYKF